MPSYKNTSGYKLSIPGVGVVEKDGIIESQTKLENQYLEEVSGNSSQPINQSENIERKVD